MDLSIPSYTEGFAPRDGPPANPGVWDGLAELWVPYLGVTGATLFEWGRRRKNHGTLTNMDWTSGKYGRAVAAANENTAKVAIAAPNGISGSEWTVAFFAEDNAAGSDWPGLFGPSAADQNNAMYFHRAGVTQRLTFSDGTTKTVTWNSLAGWHLWSARYDAAAVRFGRDGEFQQSVQAGKSIDWSLVRSLGDSNYWSGSWTGKIVFAGFWAAYKPDAFLSGLAADPYALTRLRTRTLAAVAGFGGASTIIGGGGLV